MSHHITNKRCSRCGKIKPATTEYFHRNRTTTDGVNRWCKNCVRESRGHTQRRSAPPVLDEQRWCFRCEEIKPATTEYFDRDQFVARWI